MSETSLYFSHLQNEGWKRPPEAGNVQRAFRFSEARCDAHVRVLAVICAYEGSNRKPLISAPWICGET